MGNYFGEFLINKKKITDEQLKKALSLQKEERCKIEDIANFSGKMTEDQIKTVLKAMEEEKYSRKGFSEVALELGLITQNDISDIASLEDELNIRIGRVLVNLGYVYQEECNKYLKEFRNAS
jgi:predicted transcriptional regulator